MQSLASPKREAIRRMRASGRVVIGRRLSDWRRFSNALREAGGGELETPHSYSQFALPGHTPNSGRSLRAGP